MSTKSIRKVNENYINNMDISSDKKLPIDVSYLELEFIVQDEQETIFTFYYLNLQGDNGVMRHVYDYDKNDRLTKIEDLKHGDYENLGWIVENIEKQL